MDNPLLRRFIHEALLVELGDAYGDIDYDTKDFARIFGNPDRVIKSIVGNAALIANDVRKVVNTVMRGLPSLIIPFVRTRYDVIDAESAQRRASIRQRYPQVFEPASRVFNNDALLTAFMISPVAMLIAYSARGASDVLLDVVDGLAAKNQGVLRMTRRARSTAGLSMEGILREADGEEDELGSFLGTSQDGGQDMPEPQGSTSPAGPRTPTVKELFDDPGFRDGVETSPITVDIQSEARQDYNDRLKKMIALGQEVAQVTSLDDVAKIINRRPDVFKFFGNLDGDDRAQAEQVVSASVRRIMLEELVRFLQDEIELYQQNKVPEESGIYRAYQRAMNRIQGIDRQSKNPGLSRPARRPRRLDVTRTKVRAKTDKQAPPEE